MANMTLVLDG